MIRLVLFLFYILLASGPKAQPTLPAPPSAISDSLISLTKLFKKKSGAPGVIVRIYNPDKWEWNFSNGLSDITNQAPAKPDMIFRTASVSKLFCATAILKLASEGTLKLNDPINKWLDKHFVDGLSNGNRITIQDLLRHTSGLPEPQLENSLQDDILSNPMKNYGDTILTIIGKLSGQSLGYGFYFYSNANFNLLAEIIKNATGSTYRTYLNKNIIQPLNLKNTYQDSLPFDNSFKGYIPCSRLPNCNLLKDTLIEYSYANVSWGTGCADISSTTQDLIKFYYSLQNGQIIPKNMVDSMSTNSSLYGLGTMMFRRNGICYAIGHMGTGQCYSNILCKLIPSNIYISFSFNRFMVGIDNVNDYLYGLNTIVKGVNK
ncbi:serine hydrolase [Chitinophagaceae bacterium 26-R-25]|nr:serine hydrolase [Chitinophagaceae bacterium 26-R-25]